MDVVAYCSDGTEYLIDVSARNPLANRYRHGASTQAGFACGRGEYDKERRYPTRRGKQVIPCIVESFGKLGGKFLDFMDQAGVHAIVSGAHGSSQPRHIKGRWLTDISSVINKCVARCYKSAAHGSQGRRTALEGLLRPPVPQNDADPSLLLPPPPHVASTHNIRSVAPGLQLPLGGPAEPSRCPASAFPATATPCFPPPAPGSPGSPCILSTFTPCSQRTVASCSVLPSTQLTSTPSSQLLPSPHTHHMLSRRFHLGFLQCRAAISLQLTMPHLYRRSLVSAQFCIHSAILKVISLVASRPLLPALLLLLLLLGCLVPLLLLCGARLMLLMCNMFLLLPKGAMVLPPLLLLLLLLLLLPLGCLASPPHPCVHATLPVQT